MSTNVHQNNLCACNTLSLKQLPRGRRQRAAAAAGERVRRAFWDADERRGLRNEERRRELARRRPVAEAAGHERLCAEERAARGVGRGARRSARRSAQRGAVGRGEERGERGSDAGVRAAVDERLEGLGVRRAEQRAGVERGAEEARGEGECDGAGGVGAAEELHAKLDAGRDLEGGVSGAAQARGVDVAEARGDAGVFAGLREARERVEGLGARERGEGRRLGALHVEQREAALDLGARKGVDLAGQAAAGRAVVDVALQEHEQEALVERGGLAGKLGEARRREGGPVGLGQALAGVLGGAAARGAQRLVDAAEHDEERALVDDVGEVAARRGAEGGDALARGEDREQLGGEGRAEEGGGGGLRLRAERGRGEAEGGGERGRCGGREPLSDPCGGCGGHGPEHFLRRRHDDRVL